MWSVMAGKQAVQSRKVYNLFVTSGNTYLHYTEFWYSWDKISSCIHTPHVNFTFVHTVDNPNSRSITRTSG